MRPGLVLFAAIAAFAAAPAIAADPAQLSCPRDQLGEAQRAGLDTAARAMVPMDDARIAALTGALAECARRHGWSANAAEMARRYHLSLAVRTGTRPIQTAGGLDPTEVERAITADDVLIARLQAANDGSAIVSVIERHGPLIMRSLGDREAGLGETFGVFLGAVAIQEASRRAFIAD